MPARGPLRVVMDLHETGAASSRHAGAEFISECGAGRERACGTPELFVVWWCSGHSRRSTDAPHHMVRRRVVRNGHGTDQRRRRHRGPQHQIPPVAPGRPGPNPVPEHLRAGRREVSQDEIGEGYELTRTQSRPSAVPPSWPSQSTHGLAERDSACYASATTLSAGSALELAECTEAGVLCCCGSWEIARIAR